ncbi:MAG: HupE/UreJ family protein [Rhodospirillaceae bacterium]|nr:HupE/UreJ family protein [Rhodospirillaceae bacterium]
MPPLKNFLKNRTLERENLLVTKLLQFFTGQKRLLAFSGLAILLVASFGIMTDALAHGVTEGDKGYIQEITGVMAIEFIYLGAKHMMTGYDHLLFLFGVVFFLYRPKDVGIYVTLFAVGHVITLLSGVLMDIKISPYIIDAIIGFSVVYKALDNMGAFQRWFGFQPNTKAATFIFGLFHGFGLATKILDYKISPDGLLANLIFFNVGVEIGQILALVGILIAITYWRKAGGFLRHAYSANAVMMMLGFLLMGYQITGYFVS